MAHANTKPKVLVVDDEHAIADSLAMILNQHGFESTPLYSGEEAVDWVAKATPDILVSDIAMGPMDGINAAIRIRELRPECRIILFSASMIDTPTCARLVTLGFEFLKKPLHPLFLLEQLAAGQPVDGQVKARC